MAKITLEEAVAVLASVIMPLKDFAEAAEAITQGVDYYIVQGTLLDCYRHSPLEVRAKMLTRRPRMTGNSFADATFAAMAETLAVTDGFPVPAWTRNPKRAMPPGEEYYAFDAESGRALLREHSQEPFARRGLYVTPGFMSRY